MSGYLILLAGTVVLALEIRFLLKKNNDIWR